MKRIFYAPASDAAVHIEALQDQIRKTRKFLRQLTNMSDAVSTFASGDDGFDVELSVSIQTTKAGLLRMQAMLAEQAGLLDIEPIESWDSELVNEMAL